MLFLLFQLGKDRYALEASRVVEVVPLLGFRRLPQAPKAVAGMFNYRGRAVPVVDLCELMLGQPASERLSTRIIIINYPDAEGGNHLLGLIAEQATTMLRTEAMDFADTGVQIAKAPYLGPMLMDSSGPIQWVHEQHLLSAPVRDLLFSEPAILRDEPV
jgi:chemotaxis-related protein WspB